MLTPKYSIRNNFPCQQYLYIHLFTHISLILLHWTKNKNIKEQKIQIRRELQQLLYVHRSILFKGDNNLHGQCPCVCDKFYVCLESYLLQIRTKSDIWNKVILGIYSAPYSRYWIILYQTFTVLCVNKVISFDCSNTMEFISSCE